MVLNFRHACIIIKNLDRTLKFYRDILGLEVSKITSLEGKYPEKVLGIKGIKLTYVKLYVPRQPSKKKRPFLELHCWQKPKVFAKKSFNHISFTVDNLAAEYRRLKRLGIKFISRPIKAPDGHSKICFAYDPDNNLIEFAQDLKK